MATRDTYTKVHDEWKDKPDTSTPLLGADMEHIESGIATAMNSRALRSIYGDEKISLLMTNSSNAGVGSIEHGAAASASGENAYAGGNAVVASGECAHAEGYRTKAAGRYAHAEGEGSESESSSAHAEGYSTKAINSGCHAEGSETTAGRVGGGYYAHAEGNRTTASGDQSHAEGNSSVASGQTSHAEGYNSTASGYSSHAEGYYSTASGDYSHTEGGSAQSSGSYSHAEGYGTKAVGMNCHAEGRSTVAGFEQSPSASNSSHAEGNETLAAGSYCHAEGDLTVAGQNPGTYASHAEGAHTVATGSYSHAEGYDTIARGVYQHVQGRYNEPDTQGKYAHIVGGGNADTDRRNIHTLDWEGNAWHSGDVIAKGGDISLYGLKAAVDALGQFSAVVVAELPVEAISTGMIYMVPKENGSENDIYNEYIYVVTAETGDDGIGTTAGHWEFIGTTSVDLSEYVKKEEGKGLSGNDYTDEDRAFVKSITDMTIQSALAILNEEISNGEAAG